MSEQQTTFPILTKNVMNIPQQPNGTNIFLGKFNLTWTTISARVSTAKKVQVQ